MQKGEIDDELHDLAQDHCHQIPVKVTIRSTDGILSNWCSQGSYPAAMDSGWESLTTTTGLCLQYPRTMSVQGKVVRIT